MGTFSTRVDHNQERFGRLVAQRAELRDGVVWWFCRCDCGNTITVRGESLRRGTTKSCGCLRRELVAARTRKTNAIERHPLYHVWVGMRARCRNPNDPRFASYGGRDIVVCERWRDFWKFVEDVGPRPSTKHTLDRRDNAGPYSPENCRWATSKEQQRNSRANQTLTFDGRTQCIAAWAEEMGIAMGTLRARLGLGWSIDQALTTHVKRGQRRPT